MGSEMCIRDSASTSRPSTTHTDQHMPHTSNKRPHQTQASHAYHLLMQPVGGGACVHKATAHDTHRSAHASHCKHTSTTNASLSCVHPTLASSQPQRVSTARQPTTHTNQHILRHPNASSHHTQDSHAYFLLMQPGSRGGCVRKSTAHDTHRSANASGFKHTCTPNASL